MANDDIGNNYDDDADEDGADKITSIIFVI